MSIKIYDKMFYVVKNGENLASVCKKLNINPTKLLLDNQIAPKDVTEGKILYIKR